MNIVIGSAFRNSAGRPLSRYVAKLDLLRVELAKMGHKLSWIAAEGDSTDNTRMEILRYASQLPIELRLAIREHGGPVYASTEAPDRMRALSYVGNGILEQVVFTDDILIYVESDLLWSPDTMIELIEDVDKLHLDVVSPMIFAGNLFYDIWGFRKNGLRFSPFAPFYPGLNGGPLFEVDSVGSCLVMRAEVAVKCRIINDEALVGFCDDVRSKGFRIHVDPALRVEHPA